MTNERIIRALEEAAADAKDTINDLHTEVENLKAENQRLHEELASTADDACSLQGEVSDLKARESTLYIDNSSLTRRLSEALERLAAERRAGRIL